MNPRSLIWARRLTHPLALGALLVLSIAGLRLAMPSVARRLQSQYPPGATLRLPAVARGVLPTVKGATLTSVPPPPAVPPGTSELPGMGQRVISSALPPEAGQARNPATPVAPVPVPAPTPRPIRIACRVVGCARVDGDHWLLTLEMQEAALDSNGKVVIPQGTRATGKIRFFADGTLVVRTSTWQLALTEEDGGKRGLDLSATYEPQMGGIAVGANGFWSVRSVARIGGRQQEPASDPNLFPSADSAPGEDNALPSP